MSALAVGASWSGADLAAWRNESAPEDGKAPRAQAVAGYTPYLRLTALADDVAPRTPNSNPRAQLTSPSLIEQGGTYRVAVDLLVPSTAMPTTIDKAGGKWIEFLQIAYGEPYAGSPPLRVFTMDGKTFGLRLGDTRWGWSAPLQRDVWWRMVCEFRQATDGWYRFLVSRGLASTPQEVVPRTPYATVQASNGGGLNSVRLNAYMAAGTAPRVGPFFFHGARVERMA